MEGRIGGYVEQCFAHLQAHLQAHGPAMLAGGRAAFEIHADGTVTVTWHSSQAPDSVDALMADLKAAPRCQPFPDAMRADMDSVRVFRALAPPVP